eukprot:COSAG02_NODE_9105_length_2329_cov_1.423767_4_plen_106_part_00
MSIQFIDKSMSLSSIRAIRYEFSIGADTGHKALMPSGTYTPYIATLFGCVSSCEVYEPASNSWPTTAPMGTKRYSLAALIGGLLYALGGYGGSGNLSSCEVYDPQ